MRPLCMIWLTICLSTGAHAQEGQYRSKIRIDPNAGTVQDTGLSVQELEQQIDSISDPYAKSSAGRHLARHYVESGEYDKAIEYYRDALSAKGLSEVANREMLRELAQIYLLQEDYAAAASTLEKALAIDLVPTVTDYMLLAQTRYRQGRLVQVVAALDAIAENNLTLSIAQQRQALALYYQAGAYAQCEQILQQLLQAEPDNPENWHHLAAVYLQQGKRKQALDQLALALEKSVPFSEQDLRLLADLHAVNGNPYGAAQLLQQSLENGSISEDAQAYRRLFQFWLQAREQQPAMDALVQAARLSGDINLYLYLAQLQMEQELWQPMYNTMLAACKSPLQDKYVARANLLLGVSQLKLGDELSARRSFINATLIGGAQAQAGQWLKYMQAEPPTAKELDGIVGVCHGAKDKRAAPDAFARDSRREVTSTASIAEQVTTSSVEIETKTVPPLKFFYQDYDQPLSELAQESRSLAMKMGVAMVRSGGSIDGPLLLIASDTDEDGAMRLGFPAGGSPRAGGRYHLDVTEAFKCAFIEYRSEDGPFEDFWANFLVEVERAGYTLNNERRVVMQGGNDARLELQVGVN
ncbi:MAG: tetratricopeptide repeat protein [Pseudomonadota bacterium]